MRVYQGRKFDETIVCPILQSVNDHFIGQTSERNEAWLEYAKKDEEAPCGISTRKYSRLCNWQR